MQEPELPEDFSHLEGCEEAEAMPKPQGNLPVIVIAAERKTGEKGAYWWLKFVVFAGKFKGAFLWKSIPTSSKEPKAMQMVKLIFTRLGISGPALRSLTPSSLVGRGCMLKDVKIKNDFPDIPYAGWDYLPEELKGDFEQERQKVSSYNQESNSGQESNHDDVDWK